MAKYSSVRQRKYRGRPQRGGSVVLKLIIVLLVLAILACVLFFTVMDGRVEYTDEGVRLVAPWMPEKPAGTPDSEFSAPIIVVEPE